MISEVFYFHIYFDIGSIKKLDLVELVLTAMAIYQLQTKYPGVMQAQYFLSS